jgi:hypothetical protein
MTRRFCLTLNLRNDPVVIAEYRRCHEKLWPKIPASGKFTLNGEPVNLRFAYRHCYGDSAISLSPRLSGPLRTSHCLSNCIVARCSDVYFGQCGKSA